MCFYVVYFPVGMRVAIRETFLNYILYNMHISIAMCIFTILLTYANIVYVCYHKYRHAVLFPIIKNKFFSYV